MIGERLRYLRKNRNLTQKRLAEELGLLQAAVANYESGNRKPTYEILIKIAQFFKVSTDFLLLGSVPITQPGQKHIVRYIPVFEDMSNKPQNPIDFLPTFLERGDNGKYFFYTVTKKQGRFYDGDLILIREQKFAENGQTILAAWDGEETVIAKYFQKKSIIVIVPFEESSKWPLVLNVGAKNEVVIYGIVLSGFYQVEEKTNVSEDEYGHQIDCC